MKLQILAIKDVKVNAFMQPFFMRTNEEAIRAFTTTVNDPTTQFNKHPEDFHLYNLGEFDEIDGTIESQEPIQKCHAMAVINPNIIPENVLDRLKTIEAQLLKVEAIAKDNSSQG